MNLSYTTSTRVSGDGDRGRTNTNIMSFTGALWPSLYIILPKRGKKKKYIHMRMKKNSLTEINKL